jgi:hypothetical protein
MGAVGQREGAVLVAEQGRARLGDLQGYGGARLRVAGGPRRHAAVEEPEPVHDAEDPAHRAVDVPLGQTAVLYGRLEGRAEVSAVRHLHVEAGGDRGDGAVRGEPVGHHPAVEAPLAAQDVGEEGLVLAGEGAVDLVVRAHHRAGARADGRFETAQLDLVHGLFVDPYVDGVAVLLLVVHREVLDGRDESLALDALDLGGDQVTGEQRILAEGLEVAARVRGADEVDHRGEQDVLAQRASLAADDLAVAAGEFGVEGGGEQDGRREGGGVCGDADAGRSVGEP